MKLSVNFMQCAQPKAEKYKSVSNIIMKKSDL